MQYTIFILLLPLLSFIILGLVDTKWKAKVAGTIGTLVLATIALLSYYTAFEYFTDPAYRVHVPVPSCYDVC